MNNQQYQIVVDADTSSFDASMNALKDSTKEFGKVFTSTISDAVLSSLSFEDTLKDLGKSLTDLALNSALKPLEDLFGNLLGSVTGAGISTQSGGFSLSGISGVGSTGSILPFARGGVVSEAGLFNFGNRTGLMGEAGPEAIMPLRRGSDGRLGVAASSDQASQPSIVFNVQAKDTESFRRSEGQISVMLARAVQRGRRGL
ncbi:MAG: phage tail tape measure protein [Pseudomonadota bacterium]